MLKIYNSSAGSGKTSFIIKSYLNILLNNNNYKEYKKILILTFTRKSAEDLKNKILECLEYFSKNKISSKYSFIAYDIIKNLGITEKILYKRSEIILVEITSNFKIFSNNISTIDKFIYSIVRSFYPNYLLEMNSDYFSSIFVKNLLKNIKNKDNMNYLVNFFKKKLKYYKNFEIHNELYKIIYIIINEINFFYITEIKKYSIEKLVELKKILKKRTSLFERFFKKKRNFFFEFLKCNSIKEEFFLYKDLPRFFNKIYNKNLIINPFTKRLNNSINKKNIFNNKKYFNKSYNIIFDKNINKIIILFKEVKKFYKKNISFYIENKLFLDNINLLSIIFKIDKELQYFKKKNKFFFNEELNKILYEKIYNSFPKIYEKIGYKYKYYFIDEFQDISYLQWENIKILIENSLSENDLSILVGDPKQSIYRWRGGDSEQFLNLINTHSFYKKKLYYLKTNFRSHKEIVKFNNLFYPFISKIFNNSIYKDIYINSKQKIFKNFGGYVELNLFIYENKKQKYRDYIYNKIKKSIKILQKKYLLSDIALLVKKNEEVNYLSEKLIQNKINVNTTFSLLIKNYTEIQIIITYFHIMINPNSYYKRFRLIILLLEIKFIKIPKNKIHNFLSKIIFLPINSFLKNISQSKKTVPTIKMLYNKSIYQISEYIIDFFNLSTNKNFLCINSFLDFVYRKTKHIKNSIHNFLIYWQQYKDQEKIVLPNRKNSINLLTIHKAKGLQFPIVILPFADWKILYKNKKEIIWIKINSNLYNGLNTFFLEIKSFLKKVENKNIRDLYNEYLSRTVFDNINLLYVATTRPIKKLIIYSRLYNINDNNCISNYIKDFLSDQNIWDIKKNKYSFGDNK